MSATSLVSQAVQRTWVSIVASQRRVHLHGQMLASAKSSNKMARWHTQEYKHSHLKIQRYRDIKPANWSAACMGSTKQATFDKTTIIERNWINEARCSACVTTQVRNPHRAHGARVCRMEIIEIFIIATHRPRSLPRTRMHMYTKKHCK